MWLIIRGNYLSGPSEHGSMRKEVTDGEVFITAVFSKSSVVECFNDHSDDGEPQWDSALLLVKKYHYDFVPHRIKENCQFVMAIEQFALWDLQEGFGRKNTMLNYNEDPRVKVKLHEKWQECRIINDLAEERLVTENTMESMQLSQLLDEIGEESQPSASLHQASVKEELTPRQQLTAVFRVKDFLISQKDQVTLMSIPEWQADYKPLAPFSERLPSSESHNMVSSQTLKEDISGKKAKKTTELPKATEDVIINEIEVSIPDSSGESEYISCMEKAAESRNFDVTSQEQSYDSHHPATLPFIPQGNELPSDLYHETQPFIPSEIDPDEPLSTSKEDDVISFSQSESCSKTCELQTTGNLHKVVNAFPTIRNSLKTPPKMLNADIICEEEKRLHHLTIGGYHEDTRLQSMSTNSVVDLNVTKLPHTNKELDSEMTDANNGKRKLNDSDESIVESSPQDAVFMCRSKRLRKTVLPEDKDSSDISVDEKKGVLKRLMGALTFWSPKSPDENGTHVVASCSLSDISPSDVQKTSCQKLDSMVTTDRTGSSGDSECIYKNDKPVDHEKAVCGEFDEDIEIPNVLADEHKKADAHKMPVDNSDNPLCMSKNSICNQINKNKYTFRNTRSKTLSHLTAMQEQKNANENINANFECMQGESDLIVLHSDKKDSEKTHVSDSQPNVEFVENKIDKNSDVSSRETLGLAARKVDCENENSREQKDNESFQDAQVVVSSGEYPIGLNGIPSGEVQPGSGYSGEVRTTPHDVFIREGSIRLDSASSKRDSERHDMVSSEKLPVRHDVSVVDDSARHGLVSSEEALNSTSAHQKSLQPSQEHRVLYRDGNSTPQNSLPSYQPLCEHVEEDAFQETRCDERATDNVKRQMKLLEQTTTRSTANGENQTEEVSVKVQPHHPHVQCLTEEGQKLLELKLPDELFLKMRSYLCD